jgi:Glycine/D-amino acid oxidases (deaminating)
MTQHVVVIGYLPFHYPPILQIRANTSRAGVIGITSAIRLQEAGYNVTIVSRDFPGPFETMDPIAHINYASAWAGARKSFSYQSFYPYP